MINIDATTPFFTVSSDYTFNNVILSDRVFTTAADAWRALAIDYTMTDAGFDPMPEAGRIDVRTEPGVFKTTDGETLRVWERTRESVHGGLHRWVGCDDDCATCLTCGAHYADDDDDRMSCTVDTSMVHGEQVHECPAYQLDGRCVHTMHACDCDFC